MVLTSEKYALRTAVVGLSFTNGFVVDITLSLAGCVCQSLGYNKCCVQQLVCMVCLYLLYYFVLI